LGEVLNLPRRWRRCAPPWEKKIQGQSPWTPP
jgi:hypothetical protein